MIKSAKYMKFAGMAISALFTMLLFQLFAESPLERGVYLGAAIVVECCKITLVMHSLKRGKAFVITCLMAVLFFAISLTASISFNIFTAQKAMYETVETIHTDTTYSNSYELIQARKELTETQIEEIRTNIANVEQERTSELIRMNNVINETPVEFVTMRRELTEDRSAILAGYDSKISELRTEMQAEIAVLTGIIVEMAEIPEREVIETVTEERQLKDNSLSGFFILLGGLTGIKIDIIILAFAVMIGIALDLTGFSFAIIETGETAKIKEIKGIETVVETIETTSETIETHVETVETDSETGANIVSLINVKKIKSYDDFAAYISDNNLKDKALTYESFPELPRSTFFRYLKKYRETAVGLS